MSRPCGTGLATTLRRRARRVIDSRTRWRWQQLAAAAGGVAAPHSFIAGELRGGTRRHTTRHGHPFVIRHRTRDVDLVAEVFGRGAYRMPAEIERRLGPGLTVVDAGGNIGLFGVYAIESWDVTALWSFEPDPANAALLERAVADNRGTTDWRLTRAAVSTSSEPMRFVAEGSPESRLASDGEPGILVPCVDLFDTLQGADLLKLDIEGGEWALLADPRWATVDVRALVMEWHWRNAPAAGGDHSAREALHRAGFRVVETAAGPLPEGVGLIWAVR